MKNCTSCTQFQKTLYLSDLNCNLIRTSAIVFSSQMIGCSSAWMNFGTRPKLASCYEIEIRHVAMTCWAGGRRWRIFPVRGGPRTPPPCPAGPGRSPRRCCASALTRWPPAIEESVGTWVGDFRGRERGKWRFFCEIFDKDWPMRDMR